MSPPDGSIIESNSTTFTCTVESRPGALITLRGPGGLLESVEAGARLNHTIQSVGCQNSGRYTCEAHNDRTDKDVSRSTDIHVKCKLYCGLCKLC